MRSLADALAHLREQGNLSDSGMVEIKAMGIRLPDGRQSGIVSVWAPPQQNGTGIIIFMPPSATFSARTTLGDPQQYEIGRLDGATSDSEGNVELANGQFVHQVELRPAPAHYDFTRTEEKIVMAAIEFLQREGLLKLQCYRFVDETLLPGMMLLDFTKPIMVDTADRLLSVRSRPDKEKQHGKRRDVPTNPAKGWQPTEAHAVSQRRERQSQGPAKRLQKPQHAYHGRCSRPGLRDGGRKDSKDFEDTSDNDAARYQSGERRSCGNGKVSRLG